MCIRDRANSRSPNCTHPHFAMAFIFCCLPVCLHFHKLWFFWYVCVRLQSFGISLLFVKPPLSDNVVIIIWHSSVIRGCNLRRYLERGESALDTYYVVGRMMKNGSFWRGNCFFTTQQNTNQRKAKECGLMSLFEFQKINFALILWHHF